MLRTPSSVPRFYDRLRITREVPFPLEGLFMCSFVDDFRDARGYDTCGEAAEPELPGGAAVLLHHSECPLRAVRSKIRDIFRFQEERLQESLIHMLLSYEETPDLLYCALEFLIRCRCPCQGLSSVRRA